MSNNTLTNELDEGKVSKGRGWHGDSEGHAAAGRKGGKVVGQDTRHMAEIGRRGGTRTSSDRAHMAEIGRRGGKNSKRSSGTS